MVAVKHFDETESVASVNYAVSGNLVGVNGITAQQRFTIMGVALNLVGETTLDLPMAL